MPEQEQEQQQEQTEQEKEGEQQEEGLGDAGTKALEAFKRRARTAEREAKQLSTRLAELENAGKSETQRLTEASAAAEKRAEEAEAKALRAAVGVAKKLDPKLWDRLRGSTRDELEDDADELLGTMRPSSSGPEPRRAADGGTSMNDLIRAKAGR